MRWAVAALVLVAATAEAQNSRENLGSSKAIRQFGQALTANSLFGVPRYTTALLPTCDTFATGAVAFDTTATVLKVCDGSSWASAGGLTSPVSGNYTLDGIWTFRDSSDPLNVVRIGGGTAGYIEFEGATDDTIEARIGVTDPTIGDQNFHTPDAAATGDYTLTVLQLAQTWTAAQRFDAGITANSAGAGTPVYFEVPDLAAMTGADNICIGTASCAAATTANQNVVIGSNAGDGATTGMTTSVLIGYNAGTGTNIGLGNVAIGAISLDATSSTTAASNTCIGYSTCGAVTSGSSITALGYQAGAANVTTGTHDTFLGTGTGANANVSESIALGAAAVATASNQLVIGGPTREIIDAYIGEGSTDATPLDVTVQATGGSGTDIAGAAYITAGGKGTGTGAGGDRVEKTSPALTTGTTLQTLETRSLIRAKQFTVADNTATTFAVQTLGDDTGGGGSIHYCVYAADATTAGLECGSADFAGIDVTAGAGGEVCPNPTKVGTPLQALSGSTLTVTFTATTGTDLCNLRVTADTDIVTPVELWIKYHVINSGRTITPQ